MTGRSAASVMSAIPDHDRAREDRPSEAGCGACARRYHGGGKRDGAVQGNGWLDLVLGLRLGLERPNQSPKPSRTDSLILESGTRVVLSRSVNGKLITDVGNRRHRGKKEGSPLSSRP